MENKYESYINSLPLYYSVFIETTYFKWINGEFFCNNSTFATLSIDETNNLYGIQKIFTKQNINFIQTRNKSIVNGLMIMFLY